MSDTETATPATAAERIKELEKENRILKANAHPKVVYKFGEAISSVGVNRTKAGDYAVCACRLTEPAGVEIGDTVDRDIVDYDYPMFVGLFDTLEHAVSVKNAILGFPASDSVVKESLTTEGQGRGFKQIGYTVERYRDPLDGLSPYGCMHYTEQRANDALVGAYGNDTDTYRVVPVYVADKEAAE